jgi:hypothetical protein
MESTENKASDCPFIRSGAYKECPMLCVGGYHDCEKNKFYPDNSGLPAYYVDGKLISPGDPEWPTGG